MVYGWTIVGMLVELYGFWMLFKGFIPNVLLFFRRIPILGKILDLPVLKMVSFEDEDRQKGVVEGLRRQPDTDSAVTSMLPWKAGQLGKPSDCPTFGSLAQVYLLP